MTKPDIFPQAVQPVDIGFGSRTKPTQALKPVLLFPRDSICSVTDIRLFFA